MLVFSTYQLLKIQQKNSLLIFQNQLYFKDGIIVNYLWKDDTRRTSALRHYCAAESIPFRVLLFNIHRSYKQDIPSIIIFSIQLSVEQMHVNGQSILLYIYCQHMMKALKDPLHTIYRLPRQPQINQKVVKASDIKLNDVLINGVKLRCFKVIKNKRIYLPRKHQFQQKQHVENSNEEINFVDDDNLFKNNAIKKRLRSLQNDQNQTCKSNHELFTPKKASINTKQVHKVPIQILRPPSKLKHQQLHENQTLSQTFKFIDVNNRYYGLLKKELMMYSTNNRFNSTIVKNRIQFGKYIGLNAEKLKKNQTDRESNLIRKINGKSTNKQYLKRYQSMDAKDNICLAYEESKNSLQYTCQGAQSDQRLPLDQQTSQKLKICYSTKHKFKRWKDLMDQKNTNAFQTSRSIHTEVNPEQKFISSMTLE